MEFGIQLYSLRDQMEKDFLQGLKNVAEYGYRGVEFAGYFGWEKEIPGWLKDLGLQAWGTHTQFTDLEADFDGVVQLHHALGCSLVIVPWLNPTTQAEGLDLCRRMEDLRLRLEGENLRLAYHNHDHEFASLDGGPSFEEMLLKETKVGLELDTFWVYAAGEDPLVWMSRVYDLGRLPVIHLKDGFSNGDGVPLGGGTAPVEQVYRFCKEKNIPMVVESETLNPSGPEEARVCMEYLKKMGKD